MPFAHLAIAAIVIVQGTDPAFTDLLGRANAGDLDAQTQVALKYLRGDGVPPSPADAFAWAQKAALKNHAQAQALLGAMLHRGVGAEKNDRQARAWYIRSAAQGNGEAQAIAGIMHHVGQGGPVDLARAALFFRQAAERGVPVAQYYLSVMLERGEGVPPDLPAAYMWRSIAIERARAGARASAADPLQHERAADAASRIAEAEKSLQSLAARLTPEQLTDAARLAREWITKFQARS